MKYILALTAILLLDLSALAGIPYIVNTNGLSRNLTNYYGDVSGTAQAPYWFINRNDTPARYQWRDPISGNNLIELREDVSPDKAIYIGGGNWNAMTFQIWGSSDGNPDPRITYVFGDAYSYSLHELDLEWRGVDHKKLWEVALDETSIKFGPTNVDTTYLRGTNMSFLAKGTDEALHLYPDKGAKFLGPVTNTGSIYGATLITPTVASFANSPHNHQNSAGGGTLSAAALSFTPPGYVMTIQNITSLTPASATTYYIGGADLTIGSTYANSRIEIPKSGTIKRIFYKIHTTAAAGSAELVNHYIRLNDTTDVGNTTAAYNAAVVESISSSVSQAVSQGDFIALKLLTPTWSGSVPTSIRWYVTIYIE